MGARLDYVVQRADTAWPVTQSLEIQVRGPGPEGGYRVYYDGSFEFEHQEAATVVFLIFSDLYRRAALDDHIQLHAASLRYQGKRVLAFGSSGVGKTTLAINSFRRDDWSAEGDDRVFLREGHVIACPRRFHVKEAGLASLPELEDRIRSLPQLIGHGRPVFALDPSEFGHIWQISYGPADALIELERDEGHGDGSPRLEATSKVDMVRLLMYHAKPSNEGRQDCFRQLSRLADGAECYRLRLGRPDESLVAIESVLQ